MPNRDPASVRSVTFRKEDGGDHGQGRLQPRGPGWQLDGRGNARRRGMVIQGGNPWTESGLQAIRACSANHSGARAPLGAMAQTLRRLHRPGGQGQVFPMPLSGRRGRDFGGLDQAFCACARVGRWRHHYGGGDQRLFCSPSSGCHRPATIWMRPRLAARGAGGPPRRGRGPSQSRTFPRPVRVTVYNPVRVWTCPAPARWSRGGSGSREVQPDLPAFERLRLPVTKTRLSLAQAMRLSGGR